MLVADKKNAHVNLANRMSSVQSRNVNPALWCDLFLVDYKLHIKHSKSTDLLAQDSVWAVEILSR